MSSSRLQFKREFKLAALPRLGWTASGLGTRFLEELLLV